MPHYGPLRQPKQKKLTMTPNQRIRSSPGIEWFEPGLLNERILLLVFETIKWDLQALCRASEVSRKLRAIAKRILWRQLCLYRAPRMVTSLMTGATSSRIGGGWPALAKLMFFCCGSKTSCHFSQSHRLPGHFIKTSRFSKTSGRSFLTKRCRSDLLYMSDPCEHQISSDEEDVGVYRGVFKGFMSSKTRAVLIRRQVALEDRVCPYCNARVWSMTTARLIPKSAARRLGSREGKLDYFVCVNGHLHGSCWLIPLSSDEEDLNEEEDSNDEEDVNGHIGEVKGLERTLTSGSMSSAGEVIIGDGSTP